MNIKEIMVAHRMIDTQKGLDVLIDFIMRNNNFDGMTDVNVIVGKAIDEVAKKNNIPFSLDTYYRHVPFEGYY